MFGKGNPLGITGGLGGGGPPKAKIGSGITMGAKTGAGFSIAKPAATSATATAAAAGPNLQTTEKKKATDTEISVIIDNKEQKAKCKNIAVSPDFDKKYTPEELRFNDYVDQKKIDSKLKPSGGILGSITETASKTAGTGKGNLSLSNVKDDGNKADPKKTLKYDNLNVPEPKKVKAMSAIEFFNTVKSMKSAKEEEEKLFLSGKCSKDYSTYFVSKTSALSDSEGYKCNSIKPVKFTAEMLDFVTPAKPEKEGQQKHEILQRLRTEPQLKEIDSIKDVKSFKIARDGVGEIQFLGPVDLTNFNIESDVILEPCFVNFFPYLSSKKQKESKITGMAVPARIRLEGVWPVSKSDVVRRRISENKIEDAENYNQQLQIFCNTCRSTFKFYDPLMGVFCFEIPDISFGPFEVPSGR